MAHKTNNTLQVGVTLTAEQKTLFNDLADYGKRLQELAYDSVGKWVAAGYAGDNKTAGSMYCYCGMGNGYEGAPVTPANGIAVVFTTKDAAQRKASQLRYQNGKGEHIRLMAMPANEYFWQLHDDLCKAMYNLAQGLQMQNK